MLTLIFFICFINIFVNREKKSYGEKVIDVLAAIILLFFIIITFF